MIEKYSEIPKSYVTDKELALEMAYGEKAKFDSAQNLETEGDWFGAIVSYDEQRDAGIIAGRAYLALLEESMQDEGDFSRIQQLRQQIN